MSKHLKILIPHDLTNDYINLVPLINKFESYSSFSEICLFHSYEPPSMHGKNLPKTLESLVKDDKKNINKILDTQTKIFKKLVHSKTKIVSVVKNGPHIRSIINFCKKYEPDVIMMITKKQMGISRFINSSNALKLMNIVDVPILILPHDHVIEKELRLNFLIQFFENYELAQNMSKTFTDIFKDIRFIHRDPSYETKSTKHIEVIGSIGNYIRESKYDEAFMLIRKKKNKLQKVLGKGFVDRLLDLNQAPVIIMNE